MHTARFHGHLREPNALHGIHAYKQYSRQASARQGSLVLCRIADLRQGYGEVWPSTPMSACGKTKPVAALLNPPLCPACSCLALWLGPQRRASLQLPHPVLTNRETVTHAECMHPSECIGMRRSALHLTSMAATPFPVRFKCRAHATLAGRRHKVNKLLDHWCGRQLRAAARRRKEQKQAYR
jgi:hypothetical protein